MSDAADLHVLERARDAFMSSGGLPEEVAGLVRPEIVASWRRSLRFGAQPATPELPYDTNFPTDSPLQRTAAPILEQLAARLAGEDVNVLLCDHASRIVARWSSTSEVSRRLDAIHATPGFGLDEALVGTNGVGTAVEEGRPRQVTGAEHFADGFRAFACAGAPIRHPVTGRLLGVVDLTCPPEQANGLLLAIAIQTAASVEEALLQALSQRDRFLVGEFRAAVARSSGGVVLIAPDLYVQNRRAANMLEASDQALLGRYAHEVTPEAAGPEDRLLTLASGTVVEARVRHLATAGDPLGVLVELRATAEPVPKSRSSRSDDRLDFAARSAAGRALRLEAQRHMASSLPLLVGGEPGTGKLELIRRMHPGRRIVVFDGALESLEGVPQWLGKVQESLRDPDALTVIRRVDGLSTAAARALAALLETYSSAAFRRVAATLVAGPETTVHRVLIDQFPLQISVPALRERFEDIPDLVQEMAAGLLGAGPQHWTPEVLRALCAHTWPGNIRQLQAVVRSVAATGPRGDLTVRDLPAEVRQASHPPHYTALQQMERNAIVEALRAAEGNKAEAAKALGIGRATLYRKLERFAIDT